MFTIKVTTNQKESYLHQVFTGTTPLQIEDINKAIDLACKHFKCPLRSIVRIDIKPSKGE